MQVRVTQQTKQFSIDEVFVGASADAVVAAMQKSVAAKLNFALRLVVNTMSPLQFAQEVVKRYNDATGKQISAPRTCSEFIQLGEAEGIAKILEP